MPRARSSCHDDVPGEEIGMLPFRGDGPSSTTAQKRKSAGSAGGLANGSGTNVGGGSGVWIKCMTSVKEIFKGQPHSTSPYRIPLFERASARWWNPQFASPLLETQYW